jgi:hypothetical protein
MSANNAAYNYTFEDATNEMIPLVWRAVINTRTTLIYNDLSSYDFTNDEKVFICTILEQNYNDKYQYILEPTNYKNGLNYITSSGIAQRYKLSWNTIRSWKKRFLDNNILYGSLDRGRPADLDRIAIKKIEDTINMSNASTNSVFIDELSDLVNTGMVKVK